MPGHPRHEIPGTLRAAKQQAVDQIFMGPRTARRRLITIVSTHPHDNVVGVGIGRKIVKGRVTNRQCVRLYVIRKLNKRLISATNSISRVGSCSLAACWQSFCQSSRVSPFKMITSEKI